VRALREIDRTLRFIAYAYRPGAAGPLLEELAARGLLLPGFLFTVRIAGPDGDILASTGAEGRESVAATDYFLAQRDADTLAVGAAQRAADDGEWTLSFSRRLTDGEGGFAGAAIISVAAAYFVSGYEPDKLGAHGFTGLLGTDGVFRVMRSGEAVSAGTPVRYAALVPEADVDATPVTLGVSPWDGVTRFTAARRLFEFPLAVVVGLSEREQLRAAAVRARGYLVRAGIGSVGLLALMTLLGRLSWQLQQSRQRAADAQVAHAARIEYVARHDGLTGLPNRGFFGYLLHDRLTVAKRYGRPLAVMFLDLDRFKLVNDTLGHDAGDALLKEVAARLRGAVRESDIAARLAGDEFVALLAEQCDDASIERVARRILGALGKPYDLLGHEFRVTVSIGIGRYPRDALDEEGLLKCADVAMYRAKQQGRNDFLFYDPAGEAPSLERHSLETALRAALQRGEFSLHYQEQRDLRSGEITGREALLRWEHPQLGVVLPRQFLPIAEQSGLIVPIGKWVLEKACRDCIAMNAAAGRSSTMTINLSARQVADPGLTQDLADMLRATGMPPALLELSVAESVLLTNIEQTVPILERIRSLGVRVALDGFGASYSSLSTLNRFRFDTVNIDGSVIRNYLHSEDDRRLTEATIAMGKNLAFTVVAEGVETEGQAQFLRERACDRAQGFYFGHPAPHRAA
jgi:diguanylate cyclase (GGDEF)-like protein